MNTFRKIRERLQLTQASLAESLGVTQGNVAHYESGQTVPPNIAKRLIARAKELGHEITFDDVYADESPEPTVELPCTTPDGGKLRETEIPVARTKPKDPNNP